MADKKTSNVTVRLRRILAPLVLIAVVALLLLARENSRKQAEPDAGTDVPASGTMSEITVPVEELPVISSIEEARTVGDSVRFYMDRLGDPAFIDTYSEGFTWYVAAEELGMIGRPAIPSLIERLDTGDDYERTQALYALRLAAQHENMRDLTGGRYVELVPDAFPPPEQHPELVRAWREWYRTYF